jgi:hypothetical protein
MNFEFSDDLKMLREHLASKENIQTLGGIAFAHRMIATGCHDCS